MRFEYDPGGDNHPIATEFVLFSKGMNNAEKSVQCSFCNEEYSSSSIGGHLMMCGSKTDQCPKCQKYIRRAVFAYHYENDCAKLDESDGESNRNDARKFDASFTHLPNNPPQPASTLTTMNGRNTTTRTIHLGELSTEQNERTSLDPYSGRS